MKCAVRFLALATLLLLVSSVSAAPLDGNYALSWWTVDGGGSTNSRGWDYNLNGSIGQPDAGVLAGEGYTLAGGFWHDTTQGYNIYLPCILK